MPFCFPSLLQTLSLAYACYLYTLPCNSQIIVGWIWAMCTCVTAYLFLAHECYFVLEVGETLAWSFFRSVHWEHLCLIPCRSVSFMSKWFSIAAYCDNAVEHRNLSSLLMIPQDQVTPNREQPETVYDLVSRQPRHHSAQIANDQWQFANVERMRLRHIMHGSNWYTQSH